MFLLPSRYIISDHLLVTDFKFAVIIKKSIRIGALTKGITLYFKTLYSGMLIRVTEIRSAIKWSLSA